MRAQKQEWGRELVHAIVSALVFSFEPVLLQVSAPALVPLFLLVSQLLLVPDELSLQLPLLLTVSVYVIANVIANVVVNVTEAVHSQALLHP